MLLTQPKSLGRANSARMNQTRRQRDVFASAIQQLEQRLLLSSLSIADTSALEGSPLSFVVTLDAPSTSPVTVKYNTANKTAKQNHDYSKTKGTLNFAPGVTTQTITVNTLDNQTFTDPLTMRVKLSRSTRGVKITNRQATGTINNVDAAPVITVNNVSQQEGDRGRKSMKFTITETGSSKSKVSVSYATQNVSATAGTPKTGGDYISKHGTARFHGKKNTFSVNVKIIGDKTPEANEAFILQLSSPQNATLGSPSFGVGSILNDDGGSVASPVTISMTPAVSTAPGSAAGIMVSLNEISAVPVTVNYATVDGTATAGVDYTAASGTLTFPVGVTTQTINVPVLATSSTGTFVVNLSSPGNASVTAGQGATQVTISTVSAVPSLSIDDVQVSQASSGTTTATFAVTLSAASTTPVTVDYATANGTALAGTNYTATTGTLTFAPGVTTQTIPVTILGGVTTAATFSVNLTNPSNATVAVGTGTGRIVNNAAPLPTLSINNVSQAEGTGANSTFDFTVSLSGASTGVVTVHYATADGTATAPSDYLSTSGTLTFSPDQTSQTIPVTVIGDSTVEPDETFTVNLSAATGANLVVANGTGTILNDDTTQPTVPAITINDLTIPEVTGGGTADFVVSLTSAATQPVTVNYATANGTALAGTDYTAATGTLTFAPGDTTKTIPVSILDDGTVKPNTTFTLTLTAPANATLNNTTATGTIINNNGLTFEQGNWVNGQLQYSVTSSRPDILTGLTLELFLTPQGQDLNAATPYQSYSLDPIGPGTTPLTSVDATGQPPITSAGYWQYRARIVDANGTVYATDLGPLVQSVG